ncbi:hypothetical protein VTK26DRAFT_4287 [Humicola hyalothermophila]
MPREVRDWSPDACVGRPALSAHYVRIPKEQQKLLDRRDAWSPGCPPNVPPRVINDEIERYTKDSRLRCQANKETTASESHPDWKESLVTPSRPTSSAQGGREAFSSQPASPVSDHTVQGQPTKSVVEGNKGAEEAPEPPFSWSSSPSAHWRTPPRLKEPPSALDTQDRPSSEQLYTRHTHDIVQCAIKDFPPSSSGMSEPGLEVEFPKAITDIVPQPGNPLAVAALEPTPPSAQVIPVTMAEQDTPARVSERKRRRLMRPFSASPDFTEGFSARGANSSAMPLESSRLPSPVLGLSSPSSEDSLSHAPGGPHAIPSVGRGRLSTATAQLDIVPATSQFIPPSHLARNSPDRVPLDGPTSKLRFRTFKEAYPDFRGGHKKRSNFIRAIMIILELQKDSALPEFLYDDFIRVFSGDYLEYIESLDGNKRPIPTLKWYNENVSQQLYNKRIVTKSNINDVMERYRDKVQAIQQRTAGSNSSVPRPALQCLPDQAGQTEDMTQRVPNSGAATRQNRHSSPYPTNTAVFSPLQPASNQSRRSTDMMLGSANNTTPSRPVSALRTSSETTRSDSVASNSEPMTERFQTQADFPFPQTQRTQTPQPARTKVPAMNQPCGAMLSQQSNPESIPEVTLERKRPLRPASGQFSGDPSASFKRPARKTEDPGARPVQWRRFLLRKRAQSSTSGGTPES